MFKYISVILKQFTSKQKLKALAILLIAIIVIILGQAYLKDVDRTPEQMSNTIKLQRKALFETQTQVYYLNKKINNLHDSILFSNEECSDNALTRERYYSKKLLEQQEYINNIIGNVKMNKTINNPFIKNNKIDSIDIYQIIDTINKPSQ